MSPSVHPGVDFLRREIQDELPKSELLWRELITQLLQQPGPKTGIVHVLAEPSEGVMIPFCEDATEDQVAIICPIQVGGVILPKE